MAEQELTPQEQRIKAGLEKNLTYTKIARAEPSAVSSQTIGRRAHKMAKEGKIDPTLLKHVGHDTRIKRSWNSRGSWQTKKEEHMEGVRKAIQTRTRRKAEKQFTGQDLPDETRKTLDSLFSPRN